MKTELIQKAVIFNDQGKLLMVRRSKTDIRRPLQWDLPGGKREKNEELIASVKREIMEETGLEIDSITPIYATAEVRSWKNQSGKQIQNVIFLFYVARINQSEVVLSIEHDKYQWELISQAIDQFEYPLHQKVLSYVKVHDLTKDALSSLA